MPRIPSYESDVSLNPGQVPEMSLGPAQKSAGEQQGVVSEIQRAEDTFVKIRDFRQTNEADIYHAQKRAELETVLNQDQDIDPAKYSDEINRITAESAKTIAGQLAKEDFIVKTEQHNAVFNFRVRDAYRTQQLMGAKAIVLLKAEQFKENYGGMTPEQRHDAAADWKSTLNNAINIGAYSKTEAEFIDAKTQKDVIKGSVDYGILNDPQSALKELQQGDEGEYPGLTQTERVNFIKEAETRVEKLNNQKEEAIAIATNKREVDLIDMKIAETLTVPQVKSEREAGTITAQFADTMIRALERPKKAETKDKTFNSIAEDILNPNKKESDKQRELLNKNATGELSDGDFQILHTFFKVVDKETVEKAMPKKNWLQRFFNIGKDTGLRQEIMSRMFKQYFQKVNSGEDPGKAVSEITSLHLDQHLADEAKKPAKQYAINPETKQRAYSEDGGVTWHDEKTGKLIK